MSMYSGKAVFFDRDGVLNYDSPNYVFNENEYRLYDDVVFTLSSLKSRGYQIFVVTNQAGISRGFYTREDMEACHKKLHQLTDGVIDHIFYSPYHPTVTKSLSRKPGTLLFERAIALYRLSPKNCWMIGDRDSDLIPAKKLGMKVIGVKRREEITEAQQKVDRLAELLELIP